VPLRTLKFSKMYCIMRAFLDESYDSHTMAVGGWLAHEDAWTLIETKWSQRIEFERQRSIRRGEVPISRRHAS
jgi:hypothetical protein